MNADKPATPIKAPPSLTRRRSFVRDETGAVMLEYVILVVCVFVSVWAILTMHIVTVVPSPGDDRLAIAPDPRPDFVSMKDALYIFATDVIEHLSGP